MLSSKLRSFITSRNICLLFSVLVIITSVQKYFRHNINNYYIFTRSFDLLISNQNLYIEHPALFNDRFLYSPTFALAMAVFHFMPELPGVILWNLLNFVFFFFAVKAVAENEQKLLLIFALVTIELFTSLQNNQSNPLVTALILFSFVNLEKNKLSNAASLTAALFFIKIYGIATIILAFLRPQRLKFTGYFLLWFVLLFALPLIAISIPDLAWQYENWVETIKTFKSGAQLSVMGVIERAASQQISYLPVQIAGLLIFLSSLIYFKRFSNVTFRIKVLCSLLIFLVIFNQSAESPTYITAVTGTAIWFTNSRRNALDYVLISLVVIFTSLASTSLFPSAWRHMFSEQFGLKVIPCFLVWLKIQYELHFQSAAAPIQNEAVN